MEKEENEKEWGIIEGIGEGKRLLVLGERMERGRMARERWEGVERLTQNKVDYLGFHSSATVSHEQNIYVDYSFEFVEYL